MTSQENRRNAAKLAKAAILRLRQARADGRPLGLFRGNVCWHLSSLRYFNELSRAERGAA